MLINSANADYERTPLRAPERIHQAMLTDGAVMMWMELEELIEQQASAIPQFKQDPKQFPSPIIREEQLVWEELPLCEVWERWWDSGASASQRSDLARLGCFVSIWNMDFDRLTKEHAELSEFAGRPLYKPKTANFAIIVKLISWLSARYLRQEELLLQVELLESLLSICGLSLARELWLVDDSSRLKSPAKWLGVKEPPDIIRAQHRIRWWIFHNSEQWRRTHWRFREIFADYEEGIVPVGDLLDFVSQKDNTTPLRAATSPEFGSRPVKNAQRSDEWKSALSGFTRTLVMDLLTKSSLPKDYQELLRSIESIDDLDVSIELFAWTKHWFETQSEASKPLEKLKIRLASVTQPTKTTTAEAFSMAADQRLKDWGQIHYTRLAMFAPQWADLIGEHLKSPGFANAVYWHLANSRKVRLLDNVAFRDGMQRDQRNYDQLSLTWLESRFPSVIQEGLPSSADSTWFKEIRGNVSDAIWTALEQAGQWLGCGSDGSVVAKCCVGDLGAAELQAYIESGELDVAIGLTLLVRMPLDITTESEELSRRYKFLLSFEDKFGDANKFLQLQESVAKTHGIGAPERLCWFGDDLETAGVAKSLEESMLQRRSFSGVELRIYSKRPAIAAYFSRIVFYHPEFGLGILSSDGTSIGDLDGSEKPVASSDILRIADCVDLQNAQEWERWRAQFTLNEVQQPFAQVFRTLIELEAAEIDESGRGSLRFSGVPLAEKKLASQLRKRGWSCESVVDIAAKLFTLGDTKYVAWLKVGLASMSSQSCDVVEIDSLGFSKTMNSKDLIPLRDVPPQVFSEAAAELTAVTESACRSFPSDVFPEDAFAQLKIAIGKLAKEQGIPITFSDLILMLGTSERGYRIHLSTLAVQALPGGRRVFIPEDELQTAESHLLEIAKDHPNTARILKVVMDYFRN